MKLNKITIPFYIINAYLIISFLLFISGTIDYPKIENSKIVYFVLGYQICFTLGYYICSRKIKSDQIQIRSMSKIFNYFLLFCILLSIFFSLFSIIRIANSFNPIEIVNRIYNGLFNAGKSYYYNLNLNQNELIGGRLLTSLNTLLSPLIYLAYCLGIYFFKNLDKKSKALLIIAVFLEFFSFIVKGTNIGIFRIAIIVVITLILVMIRDRIVIKKKNVILIGLIILVSTGYFLLSISSRLSEKGARPETVSNYKINYNAGIIPLLPDNLKFTGVLAISYISSGYQGLEYALEEDFTSTYGFGNSSFIMENMEEIFNLDIFSRTYVSKIDEIWPSRSQWHTAYTWWANDISFYGVFILMLVLGYVVCLVLRDSYSGNLYAVLLLPLYTLLILFIPANNVVLSNPLTCMPFVIFNFLWFLSKTKFKIKILKYKKRGKAL